MAALPQCDAFGYIYDTSGGPAADVLVTLKRVDDSQGNPILLSPLTTVTDATGTYHFTLPQLATAHIVARATTLWDCNGGIPFQVPAAPTGELSPILVPPPEAAGFIVAPPLHYAGNVLSISQASPTSDGYLSAADFVAFAEQSDLSQYLPLTGGTLTGFLTLSGNPLSTFHATTKIYVDSEITAAIAAIPPGGVTSFNLRLGAVVPLGTDYATFYAAIVHTHTRSQITDLGIFSTSQPGLVPQPTAGDAAKFLKGDGTWATVSGGAPAGTVNEWQYRVDATTFGAIPRSGFATAPTIGTVALLGGPLRLKGPPGGFYNSLTIEADGGVAALRVAHETDAILPMSVFYASHSVGAPRFLYFGRAAVVTVQSVPQYIGFYTGAIGNEDQRRLFISPNGSIWINQQATADSTYALTINQSGNTAFTKALFINGSADIASGGSLTGLGGKLLLQETGAQYGASSIAVVNSDADSVGLVLKNSGIDLTNLVAEGSSGSRHIIRFEFRSGVGNFIELQPNGGGSFLVGLAGCSTNLAFTHQGPLYLSNNTFLNCIWPSGTVASKMIGIDNLSQITMGPITDAVGGTTGYICNIQHCCGTGYWPAPGVAYQNANLAQWTFQAHMQVNGQLRLTGAFNGGGAFGPFLLLDNNVPIRGSYPNGVPVSMLRMENLSQALIGPETDANGGTTGYALTSVQYLAGTGVWPAISTAIVVSNTWNFNSHMVVFGNLTMSGLTTYGLTGPFSLTLAAGVKLILGTSEVKFGAAGTGPGGVGRMMYVD